VSAPTPPTDTQLQQLLLVQIGDDGTAREHIDVIWALHSGYAVYSSVDGRFTLQFLKAKIEAIDVLVGAVRARVTFSEKDRRVDLNRMIDNLMLMRKNVEADVLSAIALVQSVSGQAAVGQFDAVAPIESPPQRPDANDTAYTGDPNRVLFPWLPGVAL
jgi:hypothetical protein